MDTERTEAATCADIIRSAAAWWQLAATALEDGRLEDAARFAHLGHIGTNDMRARTAALVAEPSTASRVDHDREATP